MADDPGKRAPSARNRAATDRGYELRYFARKHGLTTAEANDLIRRIGNDRARLNEAAVRLKRSQAPPRARHEGGSSASGQ
ncbi:DUF3606 domain-containing protein [Novosphingobium bradum]|uniref:DUF3606 domain-containing protein n=1 Tax=Novosphingobium bradum TaxID=1737444 RepID=A0ABV7IYL0_9SPHN